VVDGVDGPYGINCARMRLLANLRQGSRPLNQIIRIGMDTSKHIFSAARVDAAEQCGAAQEVRAHQMLEFFAKAARRLLDGGLRAAHYWARELRKLGHDGVETDSAATCEGYVKRNQERRARCEGVVRAMSRDDASSCRWKTRGAAGGC